MNKRFLLQCLGLLISVASFAFEQGEYVFTASQRLKVIGDQNLFTNGDFTNLSLSDAAFGWKDATGATLSSENWKVVENPDGLSKGNGLESQSAAEGITLYQAIPFEAGKTYVLSFKVRGGESASSSTTEGESCYIDVYANADGSVSKTADRFQQVGDVETITTDWTEINYCFTDTVTGGSTGYVLVSLGRLSAGTIIGDFQMYEAREVYDTRNSDRVFNYAEYLVGTGKFPVGVEEFTETMTSAKSMFEGDTSEDAEAAATLLEQFASAQEEWLDQNSTNVYVYVSKYDINTWSKYNYKDLSSNGGWTFEGGRWGHPTGAAYVAQDMPGSYALNSGNAYITCAQNGSAFYSGAEYMFAVDVKAYKYQSKKVNDGWYGLDYGTTLDSVMVYIGADTATYYNVEARNYNTYTVFGKLGEGESLKAGVCYRDYGSTSNQGGHFEIAANPVLRLIGASADDIARKQYIADCYAQQNALKARLDSVDVTLAKTEYPWGKAVLTDSLNSNKPYYETALTYVDAEGNDLKNEAMPEDGWDDILLAHVRYMNSAFSAFYKTNQPYTNLVNYVPEIEEGLNAEANKDASAERRAALEAAIASSKALIAGVTAETDSAAFADSYAALQTAYMAFTKSTAKYGNPSEEAVVNPYFKINNGQKSRVAQGWTVEGQTDNGMIQFGKPTLTDGSYAFENENGAYVSRGYTAYSQNRVTQTIELTTGGYYEYRCNAYAVNTNQSRYNGMWNGLSGEDSLRISDIHLLFGLTETPDTLKNIVTTQTTFGSSIWTIDEVRSYSIFYNKENDNAEQFIFGLDAMKNGTTMTYGCNLYGFGDNHLYYWGDKEKYLKDEAAGITGTPVDVLKTLNAPIYNLMGVKVGNNRSALTKGLYIQNGKKFVVK